MLPRAHALRLSARTAARGPRRMAARGLDVADPENNDPTVIASAPIAVRIEVA
jgi:hypothetical protein